MHLLIDIGNTNAKAAVTDGGKIVELCTADSAATLNLGGLCRLHPVDKAIACVVGAQPDFATLLPSALLPRFHQLSCTSRLPLTIDYDTPHTLGMDRVAAVVGARQQCPHGALMVVDAGSCITIDLLSPDDVYCGGAILPGIHMRLRAMHEFTAALPLVTPSGEERDGSVGIPLTGKSTRASMLSGVMNASLFEIQGFAEKYKKQYPSLKLFLTGGDAVFFAKQLFFPNFANPNLMYIGLDRILEMNI